LAENTVSGWVTDYHYHHLHQDEQLYNILAERVMWGGKLRFLFGYEALFTSFSSYEGKEAEEAYTLEGEKVKATNNETLIDIQRRDGTWDKFNLKGFGENGERFFTSMLAAALLYDTRDFEPDPSKGVFLQYSHEFSSKAIGSDFSFHKFMLQGQYIQTIWRSSKGQKRIVFAGLGAFGHIFGSAINFIEMWDLSSQAEAGGILVLGGSRSLRGYREARFLAPSVALFNWELRTRVYDFKIKKEHISLGFTPFWDRGSVWDKPSEVGLKGWRSSQGVGLRVAWNQSTILRLDMASSSEGRQVFFGFGHIF
jgi:outer membrane protein assembly factor BamA